MAIPPTSNDSTSRAALTVPEFAEQLGVCTATVYNLIRAGKVRSVKIGVARRIPTTEIDRLLQAAS